MLTQLPSPPTSLPAQPRPSTLLKRSLYKSEQTSQAENTRLCYLNTWRVVKKQWNLMWGEVRNWGVKSQRFTGHSSRFCLLRGNDPRSSHIPAWTRFCCNDASLFFKSIVFMLTKIIPIDLGLDFVYLRGSHPSHLTHAMYLSINSTD